jgi:hypothetical protein
VTKSLLSPDDLRQQVRIRLADRRLTPTTVGIYKIHRGTGRPCLVCLHEIAPNQDQYEVQGAGVVLIAHEACYVLWREESIAYAKNHDPRQQ